MQHQHQHQQMAAHLESNMENQTRDQNLFANTQQVGLNQQAFSGAGAATIVDHIPGGYPYGQHGSAVNTILNPGHVGEFGFKKLDNNNNRGRGKGLGNAGVPNFNQPNEWERQKKLPNNNNNNLNKAFQSLSLYDTNPVGALQERFQSRKITPNYTILTKDGTSHNPLFTCRVLVQDVVALGSGNTKKMAKHNAAKAMLAKLDGQAPLQDDPNSTLAFNQQQSQNQGDSGNLNDQKPADNNDSNASTAGSSNSTTTSTSASNPIGKLQEFCMQKGLPIPFYNLEETLGEPHLRNFKVKVTVGSLTAYGDGTSKKCAKREAARKILPTVEAKADDKKLFTDNAAKKEKSNETTETDYEQVCNKIKKESCISEAESKQYRQTFTQAKGSSLNVLHKMPIAKLGEHHMLLEEVCKELKVEFMAINLGENKDEVPEDRFTSMIQLRTRPITVVYGTGKDQEEARQKATKNALKYIKQMTFIATTKSGTSGTSGSNGSKVSSAKQIFENQGDSGSGKEAK